MNKTFIFEEIETGSVVTTNTVTPFPGRPTNNKPGQPAYRYQYQVGFDGQTSGNYRGDTKGHIPACPYHMPKSSSRFTDPRMFLPTKNVGDIIEANDLNQLYDRINVFLFAWNAELNDIYGYGLTAKKRNLQAKNLGSQISSDKSTTTPATIINATTARNVTIQNKVYFQMYKSESYNTIIGKFNSIDNLNVASLSDTTWLSNPMGSVLPLGIPKLVKDDGAIEEPRGQISVSEANNSAINITIENKNYTATRPKSATNYLYHFGRCDLQTGYLEHAYDSGGVAHYKIVVNRDQNNNPIYWRLSNNAGATYDDVTLSDNNNEFIYTIRDYNEDALSPKLYYIGIKIFSRPLNDALLGQSPNSSKSFITISENDITFSDTARYKKGNYPIIQAQEWKMMRLTLYTLLERIRSLTQSAGVPDGDTYSQISTYFSSQAGFATVGSEINKDDPETVLNNYHAVPGAIIKVDFYNTLIGAYELMVNSCICNTDCACNINCVCNVNCGCNYQ